MMPDWLRHIIVFPFVIIIATCYFISDGLLRVSYGFAVIFWLVDGQDIITYKEFKRDL